MRGERERERRDERRDKYVGGSVLWYPWYLNLIKEGDKPVKFILHGLLAFINFLLQTSPVLYTNYYMKSLSSIINP